ncbi:RNA-binding protein 25-like isoform X2 [Siniperca chuatsi]|uniref:RNA-binding protein 25-like isoform X2 n=1 Tax=Siniperca chuatsi TaxID=119488 RepID=UPI001CE18438|nr:RNA-binding protein 25-like isoform X2 [Siniperca chuatsi]
MEEKETKKEKARESQESEGEEEEERISQDKEETHRRETRAPSGGFFSRLNTWWLSFQRDKYIKAINRSYEDEWFIALDISGDTTQQKEQKIQREYYIRRELFGFKRQKEREQERQEEKQRLKRERKGKRLYLEQGETKSRTEGPEKRAEREEPGMGNRTSTLSPTSSVALQQNDLTGFSFYLGNWRALPLQRNEYGANVPGICSHNPAHSSPRTIRPRGIYP